MIGTVSEQEVASGICTVKLKTQTCKGNRPRCRGNKKEFMALLCIAIDFLATFMV